MKYSLKFPKVAFNILINSYAGLKNDFHSQANSIDPNDDNVIWVNEFDIDNCDEIFEDYGPPEEVQKHFIEDFITSLIYKAEDLFKEGVFKEIHNSETQGKSAILALNNRYKEYLIYYKDELKNANHLPDKVKIEIEESLKRLDLLVDTELSINVFKDFSKNKIKLNLSVQEICWFMLYLESKGKLGGDTSHKNLIELIESHFMYYSDKSKEFEEIYSAKNTISNVLNSKNRNAYSETLKSLLVNFDNVFNKLRKKK